MGEMVKSIRITEGASQSQSQSCEAPGRRVAEEAKSAAAGIAGQAKEVASAQAVRSADDIGLAARALRRTREELGGNIAAPYFDSAAEQLERLSGLLRTADTRDVVRRIERYACREPILFLGGSFALGLLAARFLKSSAHHDGSSPLAARGDLEGERRP